MGARDMLTFDEATHTYRFMGAVVPSVTQVLKPLQNFGHIDPAVLAAKADLGTRVHEACQYLDEDDLDEESVEPDVDPYLQAWKLFKAESGATVLANERRMFDPMLMVAGTLDRVIDIGGDLVLVDLKTAAEVPLSAGPQTAAYLRLLGDTTVTKRAVIRLRPDGTYRFDLLTDPDDWAAFMACLSLHRFKEKHA